MAEDIIAWRELGWDGDRGSKIVRGEGISDPGAVGEAGLRDLRPAEGAGCERRAIALSTSVHP
jgi:hypothetical protein